MNTEAVNTETPSDKKRQAGIRIIEERATAIAKSHDIEISNCVWEFGQDLGSTYAHRLDVISGGAAVRLYFSELEVVGQDNANRMERVGFRLSRAIAQLVTKPHDPTYSLI
jgi:hypothetical protein